MVAVASDHRVTTGIGKRRVIDLAVRPDLRWQRLSAGKARTVTAGRTGP